MEGEMRAATTFCRQVGMIMLCFSLAGCLSQGRRPEMKPAEPHASLNATHLSEAVSEFGDLLQAYPPRRPYPFEAPVVIDVGTILNYTGESGLPEDFATVLTTILSEIGEAVAPKSPKTLVERQSDQFDHFPRSGPPAALTIRGSITEGEKWLSKEFSTEMDLLVGDSGSGRKSVDFSHSIGREQEVWTLTLDLHLEDSRGLVTEAVSHSVEVVKDDRSSSYGVFWRGSGVGVRTRGTVAPGKSHALRIAAQQGIIMLLGRHFRVPYWRVIPGSEPDKKLIETYRSALANGEAPEDFRLLLFAHGVEVSLDRYEFTEPEKRVVSVLKDRLGLPPKTSDVDLAIQLWLTVPYKDGEPPIRGLRRMLRNEARVRPKGQQTTLDSLSRNIAQLTPGQELVIRVYFEYGSAELTKATKEKIEQFNKALKASGRYEGKDWWVELIGHSDTRGERARNQRLSKDRAERVRTYLEHTHSLPSDRVVSRGRGSEEPLNKDAKSEEEHAKNRRVEILLVIGDRPGSSQRKSGSVKNTVPNSENLPLFPAEQWPLPRGVVLPGKLAAATLSAVRTAYPKGRYNSSFGYYSINFGERESGLFSEVTFFFGAEPRDLLVSWVEFRCRADARQRLLDAMLQRFPQAKEEEHDTGEAVTSWVDGEGYKLTLGQGEPCLKIESAAL
jgi:outer membrane protein OmpA-like peptidoglycan-associated protein